MRQVFWGATGPDSEGRMAVGSLTENREDSFSREQKSLGRKARPRGGKTGVRLQPLWVVRVRRSLG